jgi:predicted HTH transcriptional regulator
LKFWGEDGDLRLVAFYHTRKMTWLFFLYKSMSCNYMGKHWVSHILEVFKTSRDPVPHEVNELDWKVDLSTNKERLVEHLIAFANHANGGCIVFGVTDQGARLVGVEQAQVQLIMTQLTNLGRDAIEPALVLDHAVVDVEQAALLFVYICEQRNKPVHRRGKSIEETWIRSGGSTRKASRADIGALMLYSQAPRWEELRASGLLAAEAVPDVLDLATVAKLLQRPLPESLPELMRWLTDERMVEPEGNGYYITNFGGIAAARNLNDFDSLNRKAIRVIRYLGLNKVETIDELLGRKGYAVGFEGLIN